MHVTVAVFCQLNLHTARGLYLLSSIKRNYWEWGGLGRQTEMLITILCTPPVAKLKLAVYRETDCEERKQTVYMCNAVMHHWPEVHVWVMMTSSSVTWMTTHHVINETSTFRSLNPYSISQRPL